MPRSTFQHWYRGVSLTAVSAASTSRVRGYRNSLTIPVDLYGTAYEVTTPAGLAAGGSAAAWISVAETATGGLAPGGTGCFAFSIAPASSGGFAFGGASAPIEPPSTAFSFARWYRGASVSNSIGSRSGNFGRSYRGSLGFPSSVRVSVSIVAIDGAGGAGLGGSSTTSIWTTPTSLGGLGAGGVADISANLSTSAAGGLTTGGDALVAVSSNVAAAFGLAAGGSAAIQMHSRAASGGGLSPGGSARLPRVGYRVYVNDGKDGPIDYSTPIAVTFGTRWTSGPLAPDSTFRFGVRAFDAESGLQEQNLDASVRLVLDAEGRDATRVPPPPIGLRAIPLAGGRARIEWTTATAPMDRRATRYHVYLTPAELPIPSAPTVVVSASSSRGGCYAAEVGGLTDGVSYDVVVRSGSSAGEESNTHRYRFTADATPPTGVDSLTASPSATAP